MEEGGFDGTQPTGLPIKGTESTIPELLTGNETAGIISEAFGIVGSRIGSTLVEANVALTFAGARGQTEFFIDNPTDEDTKKIETLNTASQEKGFSVTAGKPFIAPNGRNTLMVNLMSLRGFERVSKLTKIPGLIPFEASTGWNGFREWNSKCWASVECLQTKAETPFSKDDIPHVVSGVHKGYPDIVIYDMMDWVSNGRQKPIANTNIPHVSLYRGAVPNFLFAPKHTDDPSIRKVVASWGKLLEDFYDSSWHKKISKDPQFLQARQSRTKS